MNSKLSEGLAETYVVRPNGRFLRNSLRWVRNLYNPKVEDEWGKRQDYNSYWMPTGGQRPVENE